MHIHAPSTTCRRWLSSFLYWDSCGCISVPASYDPLWPRGSQVADALCRLADALRRRVLRHLQLRPTARCVHVSLLLHTARSRGRGPAERSGRLCLLVV